MEINNLESRTPTFKKICVIENPLKMMKNTFCFILKALFVFKILIFLA